ncbi:hypothetical protein IE53DRAFT_311194 [Violaceomyces palustris]|uniref:Uncharacterized protein n=1 Tax=Violaceomyces palustris TaxID=1673888 RepID=A0ACD0P4B7_9BASI|nr:hypothetical protein IE53DRAFT_311194 [Violaceomyces palustris]
MSAFSSALAPEAGAGAGLSSSPFLSPAKSQSRSQGGGGAGSDAGSIFGGYGNGDQSVSMLSAADPADVDELEDSVRQSRTIEDFTRIISEFRLNRRSLYDDTLQPQEGGASSSACEGSVGGSENDKSGSVDDVSLFAGNNDGKTICCCSKEDCQRAMRASQEWRDMEADLRLSAEIGQALLRRHDDIQLQSTKQAEEFVQQRDGLMSRLTRSYKETSALERQLAQANLNLEAADSSNRTLLHELDEVRAQLSKMKASQARLVGSEEKATRLSRDLEDMRQELLAERKRADHCEAKAKKAAARADQLSESLRFARKEIEIASRREGRVEIGEEALEEARQRLIAGLSQQSVSPSEDNSELTQMITTLIKDNEGLREDHQKLRDLLDACNEELAAVREDPVTFERATSVSPNVDRPSRSSSGAGFSDSYRVSSRAPTHEGVEGRRFSLQDGGAEADHTMQLNELDCAQRPTTLADEIIQDFATSQRPLMRSSSQFRSKRTQSRSSNHSSLAESGLGSPRLDGPGLLSPPISSGLGRNPMQEYADGAIQSYMEAGSGRSETNRDAFSRSDRSEKGEVESEQAKRERDTRTGQLSTLLDYIQRLFNRLSTADVDTLTKRLQRQHLAGDVGHLARTTVNSIMRDVDGLKDHFRRLMEQETRSNSKDDSSVGSSFKENSESLVARKEFFALLKVLRDVLFELAKLRTCINEIHMQPGNAAKLLQEHLGAVVEEKSILPIPIGAGVGWLGRMLIGTPTATTPATSPGAGQPSSATSQAAAIKLGFGKPTDVGKAGPMRQASGGGFGGRLAPRASAAVVSSSVAVEVKGSHASANEAPRGQPPASPTGALRAGLRPSRGRAGPGSLSRTQSKNLSGLFVGSLANPDAWSFMERPSPSSFSATGSGFARESLLSGRRLDQRPLSRIVDDDEVSLHHGRRGHGLESGSPEDSFPGALLERTLRPRGLSDSSIRSTFIEHGQAPPRPSPVSRIITPATLALQASSDGPNATARAVRSEDLPEDDGGAGVTSPSLSDSSASTGPPSKAEKVRNLLSTSSGPTLRPTPSAAALSLAAARSGGKRNVSASSASSAGLGESSKEVAAEIGSKPIATGNVKAGVGGIPYSKTSAAEESALSSSLVYNRGVRKF